MTFKIGNKVQILPQEQKFYSGMYNLTTFTGIISEIGRKITYVKFNNSSISSVLWSKDLELVKIKGQQLEFAFMQTSS